MCGGMFSPPKPDKPPPPPPKPLPPPDELEPAVTQAERRKKSRTGGRVRRGSGGMQIAGQSNNSGLKINS
jgi:hypothetical protein